MKKIIKVYLLVFSNLMFSQEMKEIIYSFEDKNGFKCNSTLYVVNEESLFRIEDKREDGVQENSENEGEFYKVVNDGFSKIFFTTKEESIVRIPLYKNEIIYKQNANKLNFDITGKTKKILKYNCQEAKFELNGRKYTVWFTQEVEINFGPININGLPGLIVQVFEETNKLKLTIKSIKKLKNKSEFDKYKKYLKTKTPLEYKDYEIKIINLMKNRKIDAITKVKELGGEISFNEDQSFFTQFIIDIPNNLVSELKKIKE